MTAANAGRPLPVILGEAPSLSGDRYWQFPLSGEVGKRLCTWAGIEPEEGGTRYGRFYWPLCARFELRNLIARYPGPQGRGAAFPWADALDALRAVGPELQGRVVVLLGRRLGKLFDAPAEFFTWTTTEGGRPRLVVIPHPSGLNHAYDDAAVQEAAGRTLRESMAQATERPAPDEALIVDEAPAVWRLP